MRGNAPRRRFRTALLLLLAAASAAAGCGPRAAVKPPAPAAEPWSLALGAARPTAMELLGDGGVVVGIGAPDGAAVMALGPGGATRWRWSVDGEIAAIA